jgi:hypothetical protein
MKYFYLLFTFIFFKNILFCQFKIDAGEDLFLCDSLGVPVFSELSKNKNSYSLGANPTALNGTPPYKYFWKIIDNSRKTSDFLDDTSKSNPSLIFVKNSVETLVPNKKNSFELTVIDSKDNSNKDTVNVFYSRFLYRLAPTVLSKGEYDTILFDLKRFKTIYGGFEPYSYYFEDNRYLKQNDTNDFKCWIPYSFQYYFKVKDFIGCNSGLGEPLDVNVLKSSITHINLLNIISNFHNPINDNSFYNLKSLSKVNKIEIYDISGRQICSRIINDSVFPIGKLIQNKGVYFLNIYQNDDKINRIKILK